MSEITNSEFFNRLGELARTNAADTLAYLEHATKERFQDNPLEALGRIHSLATGTSYQGVQPSVMKMVTDIGQASPELATPIATFVVVRSLTL